MERRDRRDGGQEGWMREGRRARGRRGYGREGV